MEGHEAAAALIWVLHVDHTGEVERHGEGAVQETVCCWLVVGFGHDSPEGQCGQHDVPRPLADM